MEFKLNDRIIKIDKNILVGVGALLLLALLLLIFSLLKAKTVLTCTQSLSNSTANTTERATFYFKKNHLYQIKAYYKNEPTADFKYMMQDIYDNYKGNLEKLKANGGYDYTITLNNDSVEKSATIDINNIPDSTKDAVGFNNTWLYKDVKKNLEDHGFTCK